MWRSIHSFIGFSASILLIISAISGGILSTKVVIDNLSPFVQDIQTQSLSDTLETLSKNYSEIEKIQQKSNGSFLLTHRVGSKAFKIYIDVKTGERLDKERKSEFYAWMRGLHRSFFLERFGRAIVGILALIMATLSISGVFLIIRRQGGIGAIFNTVKGHWSEKIHTIFGRLCLIPLIIIGITGVYMSLVTFHFIASGVSPQYPETLEELEPIAAHKLKAIKAISLDQIVELTYPIPGDWFDVYTLKTKTGFIFIDQFSGEIITKQEFSISKKIYNWIMFLHTAESSSVWAMILGLASLSVPLFSISGVIIWYRRKIKGAKRVKHNIAAHLAEMVILVGSESGSTWGFAQNLHEVLTKNGIKTHINQMNKVRQYQNAKHIFIFTATYGDGDAPQNASNFIRRMKRLLKSSKFGNRQTWTYAILAFGDKSFPHYCKFAQEVDIFLSNIGQKKLMETVEIDRKSSQSYCHWGALLKTALGNDYEINTEISYSPPRPTPQTVFVTYKKEYGKAINAPTTTLRFSDKKGKIGYHVAGDLVAILPPNNPVPRLYSIGSNSNQKYLEICVKKQDQGICSTFLHNLELTDAVEMYLIKNDGFHIPQNRKPVTLIGAGTGIAPFVGMINQNSKNHHISLYWGGRDPRSDFLYQAEIKLWQEEGKLTHFYPAFSRIQDKSYIQDRVKDNIHLIIEDINKGGTIMVCGGSAMAGSVKNIIATELLKTGKKLESLKKSGRYKEDVY